jgi:hypothetical protein
MQRTSIRTVTRQPNKAEYVYNISQDKLRRKRKGVQEMNDDFMQYVYVRIEKALTENKEYMELQKKCSEAMKNDDLKLYNDLTTQLDSLAEELCYLQGRNDTMRMILNLK